MKHITYSQPVTAIPFGKSLQLGILLNLLSYMMGRISRKEFSSKNLPSQPQRLQVGTVLMASAAMTG